jgi:hypothetical protein
MTPKKVHVLRVRRGEVGQQRVIDAAALGAQLLDRKPVILGCPDGIWREID